MKKTVRAKTKIFLVVLASLIAAQLCACSNQEPPSRLPENTDEYVETTAQTDDQVEDVPAEEYLLVKKATYSNSNGKLLTTEEYSYDSSGREVENIFTTYVYMPDGRVSTMVFKTVNEYSDNELIQKCYSDGTYSGFSRVLLNENGDPERCYEYNEFGQLDIESIYNVERDSKGRKTVEGRVNLQSGLSSLDYKYRYTYDNSTGLLMLKEEIDLSTLAVKSTEHYFYDENGHITKKTRGKIKYTYETDSKGNAVKEYEYDFNGKLTCWTTYEYVKAEDYSNKAYMSDIGFTPMEDKNNKQEEAISLVDSALGDNYEFIGRCDGENENLKNGYLFLSIKNGSISTDAFYYVRLDTKTIYVGWPYSDFLVLWKNGKGQDSDAARKFIEESVGRLNLQYGGMHFDEYVFYLERGDVLVVDWDMTKICYSVDDWLDKKYEIFPNDTIDFFATARS